MVDKLVETATSALESSSGQWLIQLMSEGVGSMGTYPAEVLERDGAMAFPAGTQIFMDHLTESEEWDRAGNHSIKDLVGVTTTPAEFDAESKSLRAAAKWFNGYESFIEEAKDYIGLSVEVFAMSNNEGVVEAFVPSPLNAVAVVPRAGRDGKVLSLMESYKDKHDTIKNHDDRKDEAVKPEDIEKIAEAVTAGLTPLFDGLKESLKPAEKDEAADETETDLSVIAEALVEADLPKSARTRVYGAVKSGAKIEEAVEAEKTYLAEVRESLKSDVVEGRIKESGKNEATDFRVSGWSR